MNIKYIIYGVVGLGVLGYLFADTGTSTATPKINLTEVLNRSTIAMDKYDKKLKQDKVEKVDDRKLEQLNVYLQQALNAEPRLTGGLIATRLGKDAKFTGVDDANSDGKADESETKLFTLEIDGQGKRLIATDASGTGTYRGFSGMGFLAGAMIGAMLGRQSAAGVKPSSLASRNLSSPAAYNQARSQATRSRARSGGLRGGK